MAEWTNEQTYAGINDQTRERPNEWMNEGPTTQRMSERANQQTNEWMDE